MSEISAESGIKERLRQLESENESLRLAQEKVGRAHETQKVIGRLIHFSLEDVPLEDILQKALEDILALPWLSLSSSGSIHIVEDEPNVLVMKANLGLANPLMVECARLPFGKCLCGKAALTQEIQFANCVDNRHEVMFVGMKEHGHYCTPIIYSGRTIGVFNIYTRAHHIYNENEVAFLRAISDTLAGIIVRKTAEKEKEQLALQLLQSQKMQAIGTLAGGIAHDFNNILSAIIGYTDLVLLNISRGETEGMEADLKQVLNAGMRAQDLVRQILAFSRQSVMDMNPCCLGQIVKDALKMLKASLPSTIEIRLSISPEDARLRILADATQIHQVILNLFTNAKQAMPDGGVLDIGLEQVQIDEHDVNHFDDLSAGNFLRLYVTDTGYGMDETTVNRIFEPFFTTKKQGGTGLGLSVVHGIIKRHHGAIHVSSRPGKGTTFDIYLPELISDHADKNEDVALHQQRGNERILFVDDEEVIAMMMKKTLPILGYSVVAKSDSVDAFEIFQADPTAFDILVTDLTMPGMTGLDLAERILQIRPDMPVILCTGYSEDYVEERARKIGVKAVMLKPLLVNELSGQIRQFCGEKRHAE